MRDVEYCLTTYAICYSCTDGTIPREMPVMLWSVPPKVSYFIRDVPLPTIFPAMLTCSSERVGSVSTGKRGSGRKTDVITLGLRSTLRYSTLTMVHFHVT
jgi:hypothetical protein